jgi:membrane associated rhomboid family serine protease
VGFHHVDASGQLSTVAGKPLPAVAKALERAVAEPFDPRVLAEAAARARTLAEQQSKVAARLGGRNTLTAVFTAVCVALFGLGYLWGDGDQAMSLWRMGANNGAAVRAGEVYRLWASAFLHAGVVHLVVNMIALWSIGPLLEAILGPRRYVLLYGASALGGALASALFAHKTSVGASGAIFGLMAATLALTVRPRGVLPAPMIARMKGRVWTPIVINGLYSLQPGIDLLAHLGGAVVGFVLMATVLTVGLVPVEERSNPADAERRPGPFGTIAAALVGAAMAASVVLAIVAGKPWKLGAGPELARVPIGATGLTVEMPEGFTAIAEPTKSGSTIVSFVSSGMPVLFEIVVADLSGAPAPDEVDAAIDEIRQELDGKAPPGWTRTAPATKTKIGGRPAVLMQLHTDKGDDVRGYAVIEGARLVLVRGYAQKPKRPPAWEGIEERVAASVGPR